MGSKEGVLKIEIGEALTELAQREEAKPATEALVKIMARKAFAWSYLFIFTQYPSLVSLVIPTHSFLNSSGLKIDMNFELVS